MTTGAHLRWRARAPASEALWQQEGVVGESTLPQTRGNRASSHLQALMQAATSVCLFARQGFPRGTDPDHSSID